MDKELVDLFEVAKKAADAAAVDDSPAEETRCLQALKELKSFPVNYQILVSTQVGKKLRHLTKHPRKKVQAFATDLIEIWKNIIIEETNQSKKNGNSDSKSSLKGESMAGRSNSFKSSGVEVVKAERLESPRPSKMAKSEGVQQDKKVPNGGSVKVETTSSAKSAKLERNTNQVDPASVVKRSTPTSNANAPPKLTAMVKCNDPTRDKVRELLVEALSRVSGEADESIRDEVQACDPIRVAVSVESVMFEKWGRSNGAHKFKYRSIMFNVKDSNNPDFRRKILLGYIQPERIVSLSPEEMASDQRQAENQQIKEKALFECERAGAPKATTDQFKCGRCGQRKCTYYQLQTRSADEPMTTFVTCVNCNNHWKFC